MSDPTEDVKSAVEILRNHNRWRRGADDVEPTHPEQLGWAIDLLVDLLGGEA